MTTITLTHSITRSEQLGEQPTTLEELVLLKEAARRGRQTCIVYAPAHDFDFVYGHIATAMWCESVVIDVPPDPRADIDWGGYGRRCGAICRKYGRVYRISDVLREKMEKQKGDDLEKNALSRLRHGGLSLSGPGRIGRGIP